MLWNGTILVHWYYGLALTLGISQKSFNGLGVNLVLRWLVITQAELGEKEEEKKNYISTRIYWRRRKNQTFLNYFVKICNILTKDKW